VSANPTVRPPPAGTPPAARPGRRSPWLLPLAQRVVLALTRLAITLLTAWLAAAPAWAADIELLALDARRGPEGVELSFNVRFELPEEVDDALHKGVPLHFVARAEVYRSRWYWRDAREARAQRTWRLAWQPLTRTYRVSFVGINQNYESLHEALAAVRGAARWQVAEPKELSSEDGYYVEFSYRLDTGELPRPMQIGLAGEDDWNLVIERTLPLEPAEPARTP
jgi:hypothetical protein